MDSVSEALKLEPFIYNLQTIYHVYNILFNLIFSYYI